MTDGNILSRKISMMTDNEQLVRRLYEVAEVKDSLGFASLFSDDGYFWDVSADAKYYGPDIGKTVDIYATAFSNMHRELEKFYVMGNVVIVELSLN